MSETYFVIHNAGGNIYIEEIDKRTLLKRLNEEDYYSGEKINLVYEIDDWDLSASLDGIIIIKGKSIKPKHVKAVTKFEVE